jgi:nanoRNase/pAp phosphatase (c-di-AMP/oligoRNAs hydrolase)
MHKHEKDRLITELIKQSESIAIIPSKIGGVDTFCAGAGLYHVLSQAEKKVQLIYPGKVPEQAETAINKDLITSNVKHRDLLVSIDYSGTDVEKVQYNTEESVFYLRLGPVSKDFDTNKVRAEIQGHKHDLYIIIGAQMPEDLGQTFTEMEKEFLTGKIINLDTTDRNTRFGHFNIVDTLKDSVSLLTMHAVIDWELTINTFAAQAFLTGISHRQHKSSDS